MKAMACALVLMTSPARAQSHASTGEISGCIVDATEAPLPGVAVSVANTATGWRHETVTNGRGCYGVPLLPVGVYELSTSLKGFRPERVTDLRVTLGAALRVDLTMRLGTMEETVTMTSARTGADVAGPCPGSRHLHGAPYQLPAAAGRPVGATAVRRPREKPHGVPAVRTHRGGARAPLGMTSPVIPP
jgi:hypothetical protein